MAVVLPQTADPPQKILPGDDQSGRIVVRNLSKRFRSFEAVRKVSFTAEPGQVTGFLGPNGAGKTTTLRAILGLLRPSGGEATVNGVRYRQLARPARVVGAVLDCAGFHRTHAARAHLRIYTAAIGLPDRRADEVLAMVGLTEAAERKIGGFSVGMRQRLALATAMLGDPQVLVLDEPDSGMDPEGLAWLRVFLRSFAATGRTVLVSSQQLGEICQTADQVVIISQGAQVFQGTLAELPGDHRERVRVLSSEPARLASTLRKHDIPEIHTLPEGWLMVFGGSPAEVGQVARAAGIAIYHMASEHPDLEQQLPRLSVSRYRAGAGQRADDAEPKEGLR
jgi:ABC-2 type transport system ATP-binding protein